MRLVKLTVGCLSLLVLTGLALGQQQKYALKCKVQPGSRYSFENSQDMKQQMTITAETGMSMPGQQSSHTERRGTMEVLAVGPDGAPSSLRMTFDPTCTTRMEMLGNMQDVKFPLAGATITISRDTAGQLQHDYKGALDPMTTSELGGYLESSASYFPKQAVAIGEEWSGDTAAMARAFTLGPNDKVGMTCKLTGIKDHDRDRVAVVGLQCAFAKSGQQTIQGDITGTGLIDLETGVILQSDMVTKFTMNGTQEMNGGKFTVKSEGGSVAKSVQKPLGGGGATAVVPAAGTPATPATPVNPSVAPMVGGASYAGTFKDERLTVELTLNGGKHTGKITMGAQSFPLTASDAAGRLDGKFDAQGNSFDFTATLDPAGTTLTLVTGNTTYKLKKNAVNPLGLGQ